MKKFAPLFLLLAGCDAAESEPPSASVAEPTSYYFDAPDMFLPAPRDICRHRNRGFASDLVRRIYAGLASQQVRGVRIEDFNVVTNRGEQTAVLRVRAALGSEEEQLLSFAGSFVPASCTVGPMRGGVGPDATAPGFVPRFNIR